MLQLFIVYWLDSFKTYIIILSNALFQCKVGSGINFCFATNFWLCLPRIVRATAFKRSSVNYLLKEQSKNDITIMVREVTSAQIAQQMLPNAMPLKKGGGIGHAHFMKKKD